jgi:hypothetical protein
MRGAIAALALALCLAGCGWFPPSGEPFELATSWEPGSAEHPGACRPGWWTAGRLVVDPKGGTAIEVEGGDKAKKGDTMAVLWWPTFTGRRVGNEVLVLDPEGHVVATTGQRYRIMGSFEMIGFVACGDEVTPL